MDARPLTGTRTTSWGTTETWEPVTEVDDRGCLVLRVTYGDRNDDPRFVRAFIDGDTAVDLCVGCGHTQADAATYCSEARQRLRVVLSEVYTRRIAALPAREGTHYQQHCGTAWPSRRGGACPKCGALGDAFSPRFVVSPVKNGRVHVQPLDVAADDVLIAAGCTPENARVFEDGSAMVNCARAADRADLVARMERAGCVVFRKLPEATQATQTAEGA